MCTRSKTRWLLGSAAVLALLAAEAAPAVADLAEIHQRRKLRVIVSSGVPDLFSVQATGGGFEREILQGFCNLQRLELAILPMNPYVVLPSLLRGDGDLAAGGLAASKVDPRVEFSAETLPSRYVVVTRKPTRVVQTAEELRAEHVGFTHSPTLAQALAAAGVPPAQIDDSIPAGGLLSALKANKISAGVIRLDSLSVGQADPDLQLGMYVGDRLSLGFGVRKEDAQLREALDEYIGNLRRTTKWNRLLLSYFGDATLDILKSAH